MGIKADFQFLYIVDQSHRLHLNGTRIHPKLTPQYKMVLILLIP